MNALLYVLFCVWISLMGTCLSNGSEEMNVQNICSINTKCSDCIRAVGCAWCYASEFNGPRCYDPKIKTGITGCESHIFRPENLQIIDPAYDQELTRASLSSSTKTKSKSVKGGEFGAAGVSQGENVVQIKPQKVKLQLRMNQMHKITFAYAQAEDYPVDLYYLMDLSSSMSNDKEKLSTLGSLLSSTMRNITSNFRIGFGSFVDKLVMPYISTVPYHLITPCEGCAAPYGYKNHMSLSTNTDYFEKAVIDAKVSGNLDAPEGGFDAIMQAIVCKNEIGWREQARKLLVFSTDDDFHYAGDGKLGGIVEPNDGKCHMEDHSYTHSTLLDYPSIFQINEIAKKHAINLIFAVTSEKISVYEQLSEHVEGSRSGVLSEDSANVVDLVREHYNQIRSRVEMKDTSNDEIFQTVYYSSCLGSKDKAVQTNKCGDLKVNDVVEFTAEITLKNCPKDARDWKQSFTIYPVGVSENLNVEVEMLCDCPCEHPGHPFYIDNTVVCSGQGTNVCGVCECASGRYGKNCECSALDGVSLEQERNCRPENATSGSICSNRGTCICGVCECNKMDDPHKAFSGKLCECDNFTCDLNKGQLCSGSEHGDCVCGKCKCKPEYKGSACECLQDQTPCVSSDGKICSGNGKCVCGNCVCDVDDTRNDHCSGTFCENCPNRSGKCEDFKLCVLCEVHKCGPKYNPSDPDHECGDCNLLPEIAEGKVEANDTWGEHLCSFYDDEDCLYVFVYSYDKSQKLHISAQKKRECPEKVFVLGIVLGLIAGVVLIGIALLAVWKVATTIHDRREFARFEKERMMSKWDTGENPIYKQATSTFKNPVYGGNKDL